jgi:hypothetical protein
MNAKQLEKLFEYTDAKFALLAARDSSDNGLMEAITVSKIKDELYKLVEDEPPTLSTSTVTPDASAGSFADTTVTKQKSV